MSSALHDHVIRQIAECLVGHNETLTNLIQVSQRFYGLRDIFLGQIVLSGRASEHAYASRPYGWNKIHTMMLYHQEGPQTSTVDVVALGSGTLRNLHLGFWYNIVDVTPLKFIRQIAITSCNSIVDFSPLGLVHDLILDSCSNISDVSFFKNVRILSLVGLSINDVSALASGGSVDFLTLFDCPNISDVSALRNIPFLSLCYLLIHDVSALGSVYSLTIESCHNILDVSALHSVPSLTLFECNGISDVSALRNVFSKLQSPLALSTNI